MKPLSLAWRVGLCAGAFGLLQAVVVLALSHRTAAATRAERRSSDPLRHRLRTAATGAAPFALALAAVSALGVVGLGLKPLRQFRNTAARVGTGGLSRRIETASLPDVLKDIGSAFNAMLDRLDEEVGRLSQFSSDLAHEMRTPLANMLGRTQVALSRPRSAAELLDVLEGNIDELQRLSRLVSDMLFLAQADHAPDALLLEHADLAQEAREVAEFVEPMAAERDMVISVAGGATVAVDRGLVRRAITNLLSNAVRHGAPGTEVSVFTGLDTEAAWLHVVNRGEPIASEHLPRLFDRFYRVDRSRAREGGGSGLGLAIVKAIATLHGGSVEAVNDADGATRFKLVFPLVQRAMRDGTRR